MLAAAGDELDFYVVHHYAFDASPNLDEALVVPRSTWSTTAAELSALSDALGRPDAPPIAVTEHNLVAFQDGIPRR